MNILKDKTWLVDRKTLKTTIWGLVHEWEPTIGISDWTISVTFWNEKPLASCCVSEDYEAADLNFNLNRIEDEFKTNWDLEELVVHEMCHIAAWDLAAMAERLVLEEECDELHRQHQKLEERLVTRMGRGLVMAKYNLKIVPDSFTHRLAGTEWEEVRYVDVGGERIVRKV